MLKDDRVRLQHMLDAVLEVIEFTWNKIRSDLESDRKLKHALVRRWRLLERLQLVHRLISGRSILIYLGKRL